MSQDLHQIRTLIFAVEAGKVGVVNIVPIKILLPIIFCVVPTGQ